MRVQQAVAARSKARRVGVVLLGVALAAIVVFSPVRVWLASIPHFWQVFSPVLTLAAVALLVDAIRPPGSSLEIVTWALFLVSAAGATVHAFGGSPVFFRVARWAAMGFIVAQFLVALLVDDEGTEGG